MAHVTVIMVLFKLMHVHFAFSVSGNLIQSVLLGMLNESIHALNFFEAMRTINKH